jgi:selenocysteine lyase/cysteine desulfurase
MEAMEQVYSCREMAGKLFSCQPEQVVLTANCTHGLNIAINTLVQPGDRVVISGFEHNAVVRPLHGRGARVEIAGRRLFDWTDTLEAWEAALKKRPAAAVFTHVSNVFGYILPVQEMAGLCKAYGVPFVIDGAQSAGILSVDLGALGADFIAMPGHKGLLGPMGTGLLLCGGMPKPLLQGGTGSNSLDPQMPDFLPDRAEAGTLNVPGIAGLLAGMRYVNRMGIEEIFRRESQAAHRCGEGLQRLGFHVFMGEHQSGTLSFIGGMDCQEAASRLEKQGICVRAGLHCAPLAHESAGTLESGTVRISFGHDADEAESRAFLRAAEKLR